MERKIKNSSPADRHSWSRREFVMSSSALATSLSTPGPAAAGQSASAEGRQQALIAITIDLEMARNYPTWDQTEWDYEKGNLDNSAKQYAVEAARRVKSNGGLIHFFVVGRVLEQENVDWLKEIVETGHSVGNHTYDHINLRATRLDSLQPRFRRAPWLIRGKTPYEVKAENILMTSLALEERIGIEPAGFRSPGGFPNGLEEHPDVQQLLLEQGYRWASTKSVTYDLGNSGYKPYYRELREEEPPREVYDGILRAQQPSQPFVYPSGLIEIPISPVSDLRAFRSGRWRLEHFLKAIREIVDQAIRNRSVFVLLGHPSCLSVTDPGFLTFSLITEMVKESNGAARIVDMETIAQQMRLAQKSLQGSP